MTPVEPGRAMAIVTALVVLGLSVGAAGQPRDDFAHACAPLISLSTMTPPAGDEGRIVTALQTISAGIAEGNADVIASVYSSEARIENFPRLLGHPAPPGAFPGDRRHRAGKEELREAYRAYFQSFPEAAVVFTRVTVAGRVLGPLPRLTPGSFFRPGPDGIPTMPW
jgi:hypothetical protein